MAAQADGACARPHAYYSAQIEVAVQSADKCRLTLLRGDEPGADCARFSALSVEDLSACYIAGLGEALRAGDEAGAARLRGRYEPLLEAYDEASASLLGVIAALG